jgi:hypothetical protein
MKRTLLAALLIVPLSGCGSESTGEEGRTATGSSPQQSGATEADEMARAGLVYQLPASWRRVPPDSPMRLDQAKIPGSAGEADLVVFFFGTQGGGGVEDNLQRWSAQVEGGEPTRERFSVNHDLTISIVDVAGTLKPSTMGTGPASPQPASRLLGAVVEGRGGPWFFKITGPQQTVAEQRSAFLSMLRQARTAPGA